MLKLGLERARLEIEPEDNRLAAPVGQLYQIPVLGRERELRCLVAGLKGPGDRGS
jgi:hypothetical protein